MKLGADASVAAGPVGRTAEAATNGSMQAQMLSYSRSQGVFGGVSLSGLYPCVLMVARMRTSMATKSNQKKLLRGKFLCHRQRSN